MSLPAPSQDPTLERPTSVSTASTVGSPFSPQPFSAAFTSSNLIEPPQPPHAQQTPTQQSKRPTIPVFPAVLDPTLLLSARQIKAEFLRRDRLLARTIVGILARRIELGILSPTNGIGFPFTDKEQSKVCLLRGEMIVDWRRRSRVVARRDGIWRLASMFIRIERDTQKFLPLCIRIWRSGDLLWRKLILSRMKMESISSIVSLCRIHRISLTRILIPLWLIGRGISSDRSFIRLR